MDSENSRASRSELESVLAFIMVLHLDGCFIYPSSLVMAFSFSSKSREWGFESGVSAVNSRWRHSLYSLGVGLWVRKCEIVPLNAIGITKLSLLVKRNVCVLSFGFSESD